ncbi:MAG: glycosyltransferase [Pyrinomonadaceae bacterium]
MRLIVPGKKYGEEKVNEYAKIYYIPAKQSPIFDKRYRVMTPMDYMPDGAPIRKILIDEMPDMVEITDKYTLSMFGAMVRRGKFKQIGRPMLVHFSCERMDDNIASFLFGGAPSKSFARAVMGDYNFPSFDFHIANSPYTAEEFTSSIAKFTNPRRLNAWLNFCWRFFRSPRVPVSERIFVCPRGVDSDLFSPERRAKAVRSELAKRAEIPENAVLLLYAGRISPEKNVGLLPDFMEILARNSKTDYRLLIAGAGPRAEWLRAETEKRIPGKIIQLGHIEKSTLADYYANIDVFVHPNPKEPFGIAPLEAMASGVPVVAPNSGGLLFYATQKNSWLVEPTAENFAQSVIEIIENPTLREEKVKDALGTVQKHTRVKSTDFLFETYDKMYQDFKSRNDLYTNQEAAKTFDFAKLVK